MDENMTRNVFIDWITRVLLKTDFLKFWLLNEKYTINEKVFYRDVTRVVGC